MVVIMRFRRIEFFALALTLAFVCFIAGYFTGSRGAVSIMTVEPPGSVLTEPASARTTDQGAAAAMQTPAPAGVTAPENANIAAPPQSPPVYGGEPAPPSARSDGRININLASRSELMDLPGIGNVLAGRIIDYRTLHGWFTSVEDIRKVSGIGAKRFEAIQHLITV